MFLVPLDDRREWYRFHHLFRDLLRFRLRAEDPGAESSPCCSGRPPGTWPGARSARPSSTCSGPGAGTRPST